MGRTGERMSVLYVLIIILVVVAIVYFLKRL